MTSKKTTSPNAKRTYRARRRRLDQAIREIIDAHYSAAVKEVFTVALREMPKGSACDVARRIARSLEHRAGYYERAEGAS